MPNLDKFRALSAREQAVVSLAVLMDGHDAITMLGSDKMRTPALTRAAEDLAQLAPDLRMPLLGTLLRRAIFKIQSLEEF